MKDIRFKIIAATGSDTAGPWEYSPLDKFLLNTPLFGYELTGSGVIPPLHILNECMSKGSFNFGMGGGAEWKSFELTDKEYQELVKALTTNTEFNIIEDEELYNKKTRKKWTGAVMSKYASKVRK